MLICINEVMSIYRINDIGITQSAFKGIQHNEKHINQLDDMLTYFGEKHKSALSERKSSYQLSLAHLYAKDKNKKQSKKYLNLALNNVSLYWKKPLIIIRIFISNLF